MPRLPFRIILNRSRKQIFWLRAAILLFGVCLVGLLAFMVSGIFTENEPGEQPPDDNQTVADNQNEDDIPKATEKISRRQELEEMFADSAAIKQEAEALIEEMDGAIAAMDELLTRGETASDETCDLLAVILEIDALSLKSKKGGLAEQSRSFSEAVEQKILGQEFSLTIDEGILDADFDYTILDESVLEADFDVTATAGGKQLKKEIIQLRQRSKKLTSQSYRLQDLDQRATALAARGCQPPVH